MADKVTIKAKAKAEARPFSKTASELKDNITGLLDGKAAPVEFETKEEYLKKLLDQQEGISKHLQKFDDDKIYLRGCLKIDQRVKSGLDWSDVVADSAVVLEGKVSRYDYLPLTRKGLKSNLSTENTSLFMQHNAFGTEAKNGKYVIEGLFRINSTETMPDLSSVRAERVIWYGEGKINLDKLPQAEKGFFGLSSENIITEGRDLARRARKAGFRQETLSALKSREPGLLQRLKKSPGNGKDNSAS